MVKVILAVPPLNRILSHFQDISTGNKLVNPAKRPKRVFREQKMTRMDAEWFQMAKYGIMDIFRL